MTPPLRIAPSERVGKRFESTEESLSDPSASVRLLGRFAHAAFGPPTRPSLVRPPGDLQIAVVIETDVAKLHAPPPVAAARSVGLSGRCSGRAKSEAREGGRLLAASGEGALLLKGHHSAVAKTNKNRGNLTFYSSINRLSLQ